MLGMHNPPKASTGLQQQAGILQPPARPSACRHLACNHGACTLCKHNPAKRCTVNFARHYHVDERLLAKCGGDIQVELMEAGTGERFQEPLVGCRAEVSMCHKGWGVCVVSGAPGGLQGRERMCHKGWDVCVISRRPWWAAGPR